MISFNCFSEPSERIQPSTNPTSKYHTTGTRDLTNGTTNCHTLSPLTNFTDTRKPLHFGTSLNQSTQTKLNPSNNPVAAAPAAAPEADTEGVDVVFEGVFVVSEEATVVRRVAAEAFADHLRCSNLSTHQIRGSTNDI